MTDQEQADLGVRWRLQIDDLIGPVMDEPALVRNLRALYRVEEWDPAQLREEIAILEESWPVAGRNLFTLVNSIFGPEEAPIEH